MTRIAGYSGKLLRVDLSKEVFAEEQPDEMTLRKYVGGAVLGAKYLYEEVPPGQVGRRGNQSTQPSFIKLFGRRNK